MRQTRKPVENKERGKKEERKENGKERVKTIWLAPSEDQIENGFSFLSFTFSISSFTSIFFFIFFCLFYLFFQGFFYI